MIVTRKTGEGLVIGDDIEVTVLDVKDDEVHLVVKTSKIVDIYRNELYSPLWWEEA